jgi:hypothetical protein
VNGTLTTMDALWQIVELTKVHEVNRHDVEFSIAVYIQPYPANVMSVWVYLAAFVDPTFEEFQEFQF